MMMRVRRVRVQRQTGVWRTRVVSSEEEQRREVVALERVIAREGYDAVGFAAGLELTLGAMHEHAEVVAGDTHLRAQVVLVALLQEERAEQVALAWCERVDHPPWR